MEHNIPIPKHHRWKPNPVTRLIREAVAKLQAKGDSILVPGEFSKTTLNTMRVEISKIKKETDLDFMTRTVPDGLRVWRLR